MDYDELVLLARRDPWRLLRLIRDTSVATFHRMLALDALQFCTDQDLCLPVLFRYVEDENAQLREGAVCGLAGFVHEPGLRGWLEKIAATDVSADVQLAAKEAL
jgi:hypothetical protein